jgi:ubiquinone/menaquinone biosynthesis C-methylase UbiE
MHTDELHDRRTEPRTQHHPRAADALSPAACSGVEYDPTLVDYATTRPDNPPSVSFQQGDATALAFPDASFDVVFCRYLLIHMADPMQVVREMLRVVKPGGYAVATRPTSSSR